MKTAVKRMVSIGDMARSRKRSFEEEADRLFQKCLKASKEAMTILLAYPDGGMPLLVWERFNELVAEQLEYSKMHTFFCQELDKMSVF